MVEDQARAHNGHDVGSPSHWVGSVWSPITFGVAVIGLIATDPELMKGDKTPGPAMNTLYGLVLLGLTSWLIWLGLAPRRSS
ncbi:MAG: hypothetical protein ACC654_10120 [Acidimicrobiia bacterium]